MNTLIRPTILKSLWTKSYYGVGNLYTWGRHSLGCGINQESQSDQLTPRKIEFFQNNVKKVYPGYHSTAVITDDGDLYMFGENNHGQLGIGNKEDQHTPVLVEYFREMGLRVVDVVLGDKHTVAIGSDGNVYTWGYSARTSIPLLPSFQTIVSGLGDNYKGDLVVPTIVSKLEGLPKPQMIAAGGRFTTVVNSEHDVYNWGLGQAGRFGNGANLNFIYPEINPATQSIKKQGYYIKKIKTVNSGTIVQLNDDTLLGWGKNMLGQLGVREQEYVRTDHENYLPIPVNPKYMNPGEKVVDFDLGFNFLVYYTNQNRLFISGSDVTYVPKPIDFDFSKETIQKVAASDNCFAFQTDKGMYISNQYLTPYETRDYDAIFKVNVEKVFGGKVTDFGGSYGIRYAIVEN